MSPTPFFRFPREPRDSARCRVPVCTYDQVHGTGFCLVHVPVPEPRPDSRYLGQYPEGRRYPCAT